MGRLKDEWGGREGGEREGGEGEGGEGEVREERGWEVREDRGREGDGGGGKMGRRREGGNKGLSRKFFSPLSLHSCQVSLFHSETQDFRHCLTPNFENLTPKLGQG